MQGYSRHLFVVSSQDTAQDIKRVAVGLDHAALVIPIVLEGERSVDAVSSKMLLKDRCCFNQLRCLVHQHLC